MFLRLLSSVFGCEFQFLVGITCVFLGFLGYSIFFNDFEQKSLFYCRDTKISIV